MIPLRNVSNQGSAFVVFLVLSSCTQDETFVQNGRIPDLPTTQEGVLRTCANYPLQEDVQAVVFPAATSACRWGANGNLPMPSQDVISARGEQSVSFPLPKNAVMCGISFDFPDDLKNRPLRYDDEIILTFNGIVLASSFDYSDLFPKRGNLSIYDFSKLAGRRYQQSDGIHPYCLGGDCLVPPTEVTGAWGLSIADSLTAELSAEATKDKKFEFKLITTGDNNPDTDCKHTGLVIKVRRRYVVVEP